MDGIGYVQTNEEYRHRGFARRVMEAAVIRMERGEAALTMLYGITDFYPKFGYATVGPESTVELPSNVEEHYVPADWSVRGFRVQDLPALQSLYERATADSVGAAIRNPGRHPWTVLLETAQGRDSGDCRVIEHPHGAIRAYIWRGENLIFVRAHSGYNPGHFVIGEVVADGPESADVALGVCRRWTEEVSQKRGLEVKGALLFMAHQGPVAAAAMHTASTFHRGYGRDGGWMARVLSTRRLLSALQPELSRRVACSDVGFIGSLEVVTDTGTVWLRISADGVTVDSGPTPSARPWGRSLLCRMPQTALARLVMGTYPPDDLLARLPQPSDPEVARILTVLFPAIPSTIYLADRF